MCKIEKFTVLCSSERYVVCRQYETLSFKNMAKIEECIEDAITNLQSPLYSNGHEENTLDLFKNLHVQFDDSRSTSDWSHIDGQIKCVNNLIVDDQVKSLSSQFVF